MLLDPRCPYGDCAMVHEIKFLFRFFFFSFFFFQNVSYCRLLGLLESDGKKTIHSPAADVIEETVGREIFRFAQHPPHTRFDTMGGFLDQYEELLGTLSPCDMVRLSSGSRYICYPFKPEMCSKFVKYTMNI